MTTATAHADREDRREFVAHVVSLISSRAEPGGTDPEGEAGPLTPRPPRPENLEAARRYAHEQLRQDGWRPAHVDALVDAIVDLEAERLTATVEAMKAYREVYAAAGEVGTHVWEKARAASADVTELLQDLIDAADARVATAMATGLEGRQ